MSFNLQSAICGLQSTVCGLQSAVCGLQSAVCSLQSAVCSLQSAVCKCHTPLWGVVALSMDVYKFVVWFCKWFVGSACEVEGYI